MSIIAINTQTTGLSGPSTRPHRCTMITTDDFATITAPGYLDSENKFGVPIEQTDLFDVIYSFNQQTQIGQYAKLSVVYKNGTFVLENAATTDIGTPTLTGQTLLYINSNGFAPLYELDAVSGFLGAPNGIVLTNPDPAAGLTLFAMIGNGAAGVLAAASTQAAILGAALIDQYPNPTIKTVMDRGIFSYDAAFDGAQRDDSNVTPFVEYGNITSLGAGLNCQTDITYLADVLSVTYNQPVTFKKENKYNESANGNAGLATLVGGTVTIANTSITANSRIILTVQTVGGTPGFLSIANQTAGVGFDILSSNIADTSIVYYEIREPA